MGRGQPKGNWTGARNPNWIGGIKHDNGYIHLLMPEHPNAGKNGYVREHVFVMATKLGRPIAKNEVVHHINGVKDDNREDNLVVMTRSEHNGHHAEGNQYSKGLRHGVQNLSRKGSAKIHYGPCRVIGCGRPASIKGWCIRHHKKDRRAWRRLLGLKVT